MTRRPINGLLTAKARTRLATWNVRTLYQTGKCAQVASSLIKWEPVSDRIITARLDSHFQKTHNHPMLCSNELCT